MNWKTQSGPGSFRGVVFEVDYSKLLGGQKNVKHEYPLRDTRYVEPLGLMPKDFSVNAYVIGKDYIEKKLALIEALDKKGSGKLLLPYYSLEAGNYFPVSYEVEESREEGGIARFVIEFSQTDSSPLFPKQITNPKSKIKISSNSALDAVRNSYGSKFVSQVKQFRKSGTALITGAANSLRAAFAPVSMSVGLTTDTLGELTAFSASLNKEIDTLILDADKLLRSPFLAADRFRDIFEAVFKSPSLPPRNLSALLKAYDFTSTVGRPSGVTSNRLQEASNYDALQSMIKSMTVCSAAVFAPDVEFSSYDEAIEIRNSITDKLDEQIDLSDDIAYSSLLSLRSELVNGIPGDSDLPKVLTLIPEVTAPSLVICHRIYGEVSKELDLVARNKIQNPAFVLGGKPLQYLSEES